MMPQSLRSCKIAMRDGNVRTLKYTVEPIVPSLYDCLRHNVKHSSIVLPYPSMRCTQSPENHGHILKRLHVERNIRKVRFAMFDAVHIFKPEYVRKQDLWWSWNELNEHRALESQGCLGKSKEVYMKAYNEAFRELSLTKAISLQMKLKLVAGFTLGFSGLQDIASKEWMYTRRLDVRCIVASVLAKQRTTVSNPKYSPMDVANVIASHCEQLTGSHRIWSALIGEMHKTAVEIS